MRGRTKRWISLLGMLLALACARQQLPTPGEAVAGYAVTAQTLVRAQLARTTGPVPEFAPVWAIVTHEDVVEVAPELNPLLSQLLGGKHLIAHHQWPDSDPEPGDVDPFDDTVMWMRDYQPIFVRGRDGQLTALYYLSANANRSRYRMPQQRRVADRQSVLPILHENGNLVSSGRHVFFAETLFEENGEATAEHHLLAAGYRPRTERELLRLMGQAFVRKEADLIPMPAMPFESTGHIDIYLLPLDEQTVALPSIEDDALKLVASDRARFEIAKVIQTFLDEQAAYLGGLGLDVVRMPMIAPALDEPEDGDADGDELDLVVFTPANSLLINTGRKRLVIMPSFEETPADPLTHVLLATYRLRWESAFRKHGWEPHGVDTSELVGYLGLLRCVSATLPQ